MIHNAKHSGKIIESSTLIMKSSINFVELYSVIKAYNLVRIK